MKKVSILLLIILASTIQSTMLYGQAINQSFRATSILTRSAKIGTGDLIVGIPSERASDVIGDSYWDIHFGPSAILLYEKEKLVEGYFTRYDVQNDEFEFLTDKQIKVLPGSKVKNIAWMDSVTEIKRFLVNAKEYTTEGVPLTGFFEVLVDGKTALFKKIYLEIKKPDFSPALNVGSKDTRIIKRDQYYFNSGKEVYRIKSKKDLEPLFRNKAEQMNSFIKDEKIKFTKEYDLMRLFVYYATL
jgi:hypothetical protein